MESWEDDNFEPSVIPTSTVSVNNKWEGEDEDEDVKESWEDEDEEKPEVEEKKPTESKKSRKKLLEEKIAEKERQKQIELERRLKEQEDELSPEEKLRIQKESDLKVALETTFGGDLTEIDGFSLPKTKEEYEKFANTLSEKLNPLTKSTDYPVFIEGLVRNLCVTMSSLDIKKIKNTLDNLYLEKQKIEKGDKSKKNKGKGKAKLKLEGDNQMYTPEFNDYDDYDDFM